MYKDAYLLYQQNNLKPAMEKVNEAMAGEKRFYTATRVVESVIMARTEDVTGTNTS